MIEKIVIDYLRNNGVMAYLEEPETKPTKYVVLNFNGYPNDNGVQTVNINADVYDETQYKTSVFAKQLIELMEQIDSVDCVGKCVTNRWQSNIDIIRKRNRYNADFFLTYIGD